MSDDKKQVSTTEALYERAILDAELVDIDILCSIVPGSRLYDVITTPIDSRIDEA